MNKKTYTSFTLISIIFTMSLMTHSDDANSQVPMFTECYHEIKGVLRPNAYAFTQGGASCPPCGAVTACANDLEQEQITHKAGYVAGYFDTPEIPPHLCKVIERHEW